MKCFIVNIQQWMSSFHSGFSSTLTTARVSNEISFPPIFLVMRWSLIIARIISIVTFLWSSLVTSPLYTNNSNVCRATNDKTVKIFALISSNIENERMEELCLRVMSLVVASLHCYTLLLVSSPLYTNSSNVCRAMKLLKFLIPMSKIGKMKELINHIANNNFLSCTNLSFVQNALKF